MIPILTADLLVPFRDYLKFTSNHFFLTNLSNNKPLE
tara:strand:+ start:285 stop:395 length:111 start_codon:yes stop_codon:yes gene_type:complete